MPFALPLLFLFDLLLAALTFAAVASVPPLRRSAITAPVFIFISAPSTVLLIITAGPQFLAVSGSETSIALRTILVFIVIGSIAAAYVAALACRFIFQSVAPRVERLLGLRPLRILQGAILSGGTLSLLVLLVGTPNIAYQCWTYGSRRAALSCGLIGALGVLACVLALLRLRTPQQYLPKPLPDFLSRLIFKQSRTAHS